jgi:hypothetical protein
MHLQGTLYDGLRILYLQQETARSGVRDEGNRGKRCEHRQDHTTVRPDDCTACVECDTGVHLRWEERMSLAAIALLLIACSGDGASSSAAGTDVLATVDPTFGAFSARLAWTRQCVPNPTAYELDHAAREKFVAVEDAAVVAFTAAATEYTYAVQAIERAMREGKDPTADEVAALLKGRAAIRTIATDAAAQALAVLGDEGRKALVGSDGSLGLVIVRGAIDLVSAGGARLQFPTPGVLGLETSAEFTELQTLDQERAGLRALDQLAWHTSLSAITVSTPDPGAALKAAVDTQGPKADADMAQRVALAARYARAVPADKRASVLANKSFRAWAGTLPPMDEFSFAFGIEDAGNIGNAGGPGMGGPGMGGPGMGGPGMGGPGMGGPGMGGPGMGGPGMGTGGPGMGTGSLGTGAPGMGAGAQVPAMAPQGTATPPSQ